MPQDLLTDPRTEVASTLATSGLPLLARAVAAGAVGGAGLHAVLDCLASLAADGHDAAALAEAEEFLTSIAAATDPAHVGQELRVHCDEVLRPHLAAGDQDDDEDEARSDEARSDEARLEEPVSDGPETAAAAIAVDASAPDGRSTAAAQDGVSVDAPTPDESGRIAAGSPDHERADEDGGPPARRDVRSRSRTSRPRDRQRLRRRRSAGRADPVSADRRARRDRPSGTSVDAPRPRGPAHRPSGPRNRRCGRTGDGEARAGPCRRQDDELCAVGPAGHRRVEVRVRRRRRGFRGEGLRAVEVLEAAPAVGALPDDYLDGVVGDDPSFRPAVAPVTRAVRGPVG